MAELNTCTANLGTCTTDLAVCEAATCGNGIAEFGEECDEANLQGASCATEEFAFGTLACSGCTLDTSGCTNARFVDNGNGTITDNQTGLVWEKKSDDGSVHDKDNSYTWNTTFAGTTPNGTVFTDFLGALNNCVSSDGGTVTGGFAGRCNWRLPTVAELRTILLAPFPCGTSPCIHPIFGPTAAAGYWSSTSFADFPLVAWGVAFGGSGDVFFTFKASAATLGQCGAARDLIIC